MKIILLTLLLILPHQSAGQAILNEIPLVDKYPSNSAKVNQNVKYSLLGVYTVTAYCPCVKCCGKDNGITASGAVAVEGITVACELPFDTELTIESVGSRIVQDRGGAIYGKRIDMFMDRHEEALKFGVKKVKVWTKED